MLLVRVPTVEGIKQEYERAMRSAQSAYSDRRDHDTAGRVRYEKGKITEDITKDMIRIAWNKVGGQSEALNFSSNKVNVRKNPSDEDFYALKQDVHVFINGQFRITVECKAYTEVAMYKRVITDAWLLKQSVSTVSGFYLVQLENFLGGNYGTQISGTGSRSVRALNKFFPIVDLKILTLVNGDRDITRPLHVARFYKPLDDARLRYAIEQFENELRQIN